MNISPYWQKTHAARAWGSWPVEHLIRFILTQYRDVDDRSKIKILDVGCGAGASTMFLAQEGFSVLAVDGSADALERLRQGLIDRSIPTSSVCAQQADLTRYETPIKIDCIVDICTLQHLAGSDAKAFIRRAKRWLKPNTLNNGWPATGWFFSMMAAPGSDFSDEEKPTIIDKDWIAEAFEGYSVRIGHESVTRPSGRQVNHWIIEARPADVVGMVPWLCPM